MTSKNLRRIEPTEHQIQCAIVEWANKAHTRNCLSIIGEFLIAYPNGGSRKKIKLKCGKFVSLEGKRLKKEGVKAGVSDLFLALPSKGFGGLWLEVKTSKGKVSKAQQSWRDLMRSTGYCAGVVRSVDEGIQVIKYYLGIK